MKRQFEDFSLRYSLLVAAYLGRYTAATPLPHQRISTPKATIAHVRLVILFFLHGVYSSWR